MALLALNRGVGALALGTIILSQLLCTIHVIVGKEGISIVEAQGEWEPDKGCNDGKPHASPFILPSTVIRDH